MVLLAQGSELVMVLIILTMKIGNLHLENSKVEIFVRLMMFGN
jgi:hypothetical protein